uniref:ORF73a n=1 Tax=Pinus thunbergii TaxID=3350 RepID=Q32937_PINTH|nr:ORF73a [Pinus thunbergii]BAA04332.1 ORF73a [Pinus thunbergii]
MVRGPSSYIYHIWISTIKIYLSIYGCKRRSSTKEKVRYSFPPYYFFFSFQKKLKAIPTLYCCNTIDPPYIVVI